MLEKRIIDVPFTAGPDDKINPHLRAAGQLSKLENCYQQKHGKVQKRGGQAVIAKDTTSGGLLSAVSGLHRSDGEIVLSGPDYIHSWSPNHSSWSPKGYLVPVDVSPIVVDTACSDSPYSLALAGIGDTLCVLYSSDNPDRTFTGVVPGMIRVSLVDINSGSVVLRGSLIGATTFGFVAAVAAMTSKFAIPFIDDTTGNDILIKLVSGVNTSNPTIPIGAPVIANDRLANNTKLRCCAVSGSLAAVAYKDTAGRLSILTVDDSGTVISTVTVAPVGTLMEFDLCWSPTSSRLFAVYIDGVTVKTAAFTSLLAQTLAPTLVDTASVAIPPSGVVVGTMGSGARVFWTITNTTTGLGSPTAVRVADLSTGGVAVAAGLFRQSCAVASKPFDLGEQIWVSVKGPLQSNTAFLVSYKSDGKVVTATVLSGQLHSAGGTVYEHSSSSSFSVFYRNERSALSTGVSGGRYDKSALVVRVVEGGGSVPCVSCNGGALFGGGSLRFYDGFKAYLAAMEMQHPTVTVAQTAGAGSLADGVYGVAVCYRWVDGKGNEYWSPPAFHTVTIAGGGGTATISFVAAGPANTLNQNGFTDKPCGLVAIPGLGWSVSICAFRTTVGGSIYYFERARENYNDGTWSASMVLGLVATPGSDAAVATNAILHTTGGALAPILPPCPHHIATDGSTAALIPGDNRETIWVSTPIVRGMGVGFTDDLIYPVLGSGDAEALVFMDGRLLVLCTKGARVMVGTPPSATGEGGYSDSEAITGAPGCIGWRSVAVIPQGVIYQSAKGFYLLGRDLVASYIGAAVENYNAQTVKSVAVLEEINHVRFVMSGGDVLVYDWDHGNWPRFTFVSDPVASTIWGGNWIIATAAALIGNEDGATWRDFNADVITAKCRTGWLRVSALQGYERVRRAILLAVAASQASPSDRLTVRAYYNFDETTATVLVNAITVGATAAAVIEERITLPVQKCSAVMLEFEWYSAVAKESLALTGVSFEAGTKKGAPRLAAGNTR